MKPKQDSSRKYSGQAYFRTPRKKRLIGRRFIWLSILVFGLYVAVLGYEHLKPPSSPVKPIAVTLETPAVSPPPTAEPSSRPIQIAAHPAGPPVKIASQPKSGGNGQGKNTPTKPAKEEYVKFLLTKHRSGNFFGQGMINGKDVLFMADTGASHVVVPQRIAESIGLKKGDEQPFHTGGGLVVHYATMLDKLTLGQIEMRGVPAVINPAMSDDFVLLGMSALSALNIHIEKENMVLQYRLNHPKPPANLGPLEEKPFQRSVKECMGQGNKFDQAALDCLKGQ